MKKAIFIAVCVIILFSGCTNMDIINNGLWDTEKPEGTKGAVDLDCFNSKDGPLCGDDDTEYDINSEKISEDIDITEYAQEQGITEYDVIIDGLERDSLPKSNKGGGSYEILCEYDTGIPQELDVNMIYEIYNVAFDYVIAMTDNINIRSAPSTSSQVVGMAHSLEKLNVIAKVKGQYLGSYGSNVWYQIAWNDVGTIKEGYIFGDLVSVRRFNFTAMLDAVRRLKSEIDGNIVAYVDNYKNRNGEAPLCNGLERDKFDVPRYQAAPAYYKAASGSEFRYIPDGMLVTLLDETDNYFKVFVPAYEEAYFVPKNYLSIENAVNNLKQVVVIDRTNQNQAVFQYFDGKWQIVSYSYATTGGDENYRYPTPKGFFAVMGKREKFEYLDASSGKASGYAPYAVRFSGGSYIHGIPVKYDQPDGGKTDAGLREYLFTLGTFPRTNGTVRNYTSHAKFLYEWLVVGESAIIVIE